MWTHRYLPIRPLDERRMNLGNAKGKACKSKWIRLFKKPKCAVSVTSAECSRHLSLLTCSDIGSKKKKKPLGKNKGRVGLNFFFLFSLPKKKKKKKKPN